MSPHRLTIIRRFKISNDVLILILEHMDPDTLYLTCKVSSLTRLHINRVSHETQPYFPGVPSSLCLDYGVPTPPL